MKKKCYEKPQMTVVCLGPAEIICASNPPLPPLPFQVEGASFEDYQEGEFSWETVKEE